MELVQMISSGLAEGNIALDVLVETGDQVRTELADQLLAGTTEAQKNYRDRVLEHLRAGELKLVQVSPSYGGEMLAICKKIEHDVAW